MKAHTAAAGTTSSSLGVYRGGGARNAVTSYERWLGQDVGWVEDFLPRDSWAAIESPQWIMAAWQGSGHRLTLTVPMLPDHSGTLAAGANGSYDKHFTTLARALVAGGYANATLRLGPEFNGNWFRWSAIGQEKVFARYWRHIVRAMRAVPGQHFTFDWCPNPGSRADAQAYPGNAYVDYVGLDAYDQDWLPGWKIPETRWQDILDEPYGLKWQKGFAAAHHKQMTLPEWGVYARPDGHGGGDDPYYIRQMYKWIGENDYVYAVYFEFNAPDGDHQLEGNEFPNAAAAFLSTFSSPNMRSHPEIPSP